MSWVDAWIGLPYANLGRGPAYDCWGLVMAVLREQGVRVPDYRGEYWDAGSFSLCTDAAMRVLPAQWQSVERPQALDLVMLTIAKLPRHCGVMVSPTHFLHVPPPARDGQQTLSCVEPLDCPQWARRIGGFWRWVR